MGRRRPPAPIDVVQLDNDGPRISASHLAAISTDGPGLASEEELPTEELGQLLAQAKHTPTPAPVVRGAPNRTELALRYLPVVAAIAAFLLVLSLPASFGIYHLIRSMGSAGTETVDIQPPIAPVPVPAPSEEVEPEAAEEVEAAEPQPQPQPQPQPRPAPSGPSALISQGWATVARNPGEARDLFTRALAEAPGNHEAHYGRGYAILKLGDVTGARADLCAARGGSDTDTDRDVRSLLRRNQLSCD